MNPQSSSVTIISKAATVNKPVEDITPHIVSKIGEDEEE
jgi:hypothetical protein